MKDVRIGIIGGGVVGQATARAYVEHVKEVWVYDLCPIKRNTANLHDVLSCHVVFICVPECEVEPLVGLSFFPREVPVVIKSTVPIGTTKRLSQQYRRYNLVHSPEFLTERCALTDAMMPARNVIGASADSEPQASAVEQLYLLRWPHVPLYKMSSDESEAAKLFENTFSAVKVSVFNELCMLAKTLGLDWGAVLNVMLSGGRIAPSHTQVPGPDGKFGFGGKCLPKDLREVCMTGARVGIDMAICLAANYRNGVIDRKDEQ